MKDKITTVLPVNEKEKIVEQFIEGNKTLLTKYPLVVINKSGGDKLKQYSSVYINNKEKCLSSARRTGIDLVKTEYTLNLDVDSILSINYVEQALELLQSSNIVGAVSIDYCRLQGHLAFGLSIWRTNLLKMLYDWKESKVCECNYMWGKLNSKTKFILSTINCRAKHLKEKK